MAKLIKSLLQTGEKRKSRYEETDEEKPNTSSPIDDRRKLSISRSGRMRANRKRLSLLDVCDQEIRNEDKSEVKKHNGKLTNKDNKRNQSGDLTPEEEIDNAFGNIAA